MRWRPTIRVAPPFYDDPKYIQILARSVQKQIDALDERPEVLVASFHGVPKEYLLLGSVSLPMPKDRAFVEEALGWPEAQFRVAFQSRFGPKRMVKALCRSVSRGVRSSRCEAGCVVVSPAFFSDCVETLEEIAIGLNETFQEAGGDQLIALDCLNARVTVWRYSEYFARRELKGWLD